MVFNQTFEGVFPLAHMRYSRNLICCHSTEMLDYQMSTFVSLLLALVRLESQTLCLLLCNLYVLHLNHHPFRVLVTLLSCFKLVVYSSLLPQTLFFEMLHLHLTLYFILLAKNVLVMRIDVAEYAISDISGVVIVNATSDATLLRLIRITVAIVTLLSKLSH